MIIGIPKEIKEEEYRVSITPEGVRELVRAGHSLLVEPAAGEGGGFSDREYSAAGAGITDRISLFTRAELIVKVKEPVPDEYDLIRTGQMIFTFLHLAANRPLLDLLIRKGTIALGYETLEKNGALPLLAPMSEIAGRMAPLLGSFYLQRFKGGTGVLPAGSAGVAPAKAVILGAGVVGTNAARVALGIGMEAVVISKGYEGLRRIDEIFLGRAKTLPLSHHNIETEIANADIVIGAILVPGGRTPILITRGMLKKMKKGSVLVDVAVDQGGVAETTRPTKHEDPVYEEEGVIHYCVANMPGAYPRTSTLALTNVTLPYIKSLASGLHKAFLETPELKSAVNIYLGQVANKALAASAGLIYTDLDEILKASVTV